MTSEKYFEWAITKDRTEDQYEDFYDRLGQGYYSNIQMLHAVLGIAGETGEVVECVKKSLLYGKELDKQHVKEEVGDALWYFSLLLHSIGSSFDEVMQMNHDKLEKRFPGGFTEKLALERKDKI